MSRWLQHARHKHCHRLELLLLLRRRRRRLAESRQQRHRGTVDWRRQRQVAGRDGRQRR
jgi:hypothetical protein